MILALSGACGALANEDTGRGGVSGQETSFQPTGRIKNLQNVQSGPENKSENDARNLEPLGESLEKIGKAADDMTEDLRQILEMADEELSSIPPDEITPEQKKELIEPREKKAEVGRGIEENGHKLEAASGSDAPGEAGPPAPTKTPSGFSRIDLPQIGGAVDIPQGWSVPTSGQMKESISLIVPPDGVTSEDFMRTIDQYSENGFVATKLPEPTDQPQSGLIIFWVPKPTVLNGQTDVLGAVMLLGQLNKSMVKVRRGNRNFSLVKKPSLIDNKGTGAWVEYKTDTLTKKGHAYTVAKRLYMLIGKRNIIIVTLAVAEGDEDATRDLWQAFSTLKYTR